jgi:hypothetical protein
VAKIVVGADVSPGALAGGADAAWLWLASLQVMHP